MFSTTISTPPAVEGPPDGTPFNRMDRTARYRWWRPALGMIVVVAAIAVVPMAPAQVVRKIMGFGGDLPVLGQTSGTALNILGVSLLIPVVLITVRYIGGRPAGTVISVAGRMRWRWLRRCLLLALPVMPIALGLAGLLQAVTSPSPEPTTPVTIPAVTWATVAGLALLPALAAVAAASEEVVCRGWWLQTVGGLTRSPWPAVVTQAIVFTVPHGFAGNLWGYLDLLLYSIIIGWLTVATGGIEAGIALHIVWNMPAALAAVFIVTDSVDNISGAPWQLVAGHLTGALIYAGLVLRAGRRRIERTVTTSRSTNRPAPDAGQPHLPTHRPQLPHDSSRQETTS